MQWPEILSTINKNFESLPEKEKKEAFLQVIDSIENSDNFQKAKKYWDELAEEDKMKYYKDWWGSWKFLTTWPLTPRINKDWIKIDLKDNMYTVMSPVMRLFVSFWILDKPKELSYEDLINNIETDAKALDRYITILEIVSIYYSELWELLEILKYLKPYAKWYKKNWAQLVQERIRDKQTNDTKNWIIATLYPPNDNIEKKAA